MQVIVIQDILHLVKGKAYQVCGSRRSDECVQIRNEKKELKYLKINEHCIFRAETCHDVNSDDYRDMLLSYAEAVECCGGDPSSFINRTDSMTVRELMLGMCKNGLRFTKQESFYNKQQAAKEPKVFEPKYQGHGGMGEAYANFRELDLLEGNRG